MTDYAHIVDFLRYLGCEAEAVQATTAKLTSFGPDVEDAYVAAIDLRGGGIASLEVSRVAWGWKGRQRIEFNGRSGSLWWDMEDLNRFHVFYSGDEPVGPGGFRDILVTQPDHPFLDLWWPPGHTHRLGAHVSSTSGATSCRPSSTAGRSPRSRRRSRTATRRPCCATRSYTSSREGRRDPRSTRCWWSQGHERGRAGASSAIAMVGAGTMARAHSAALSSVAALYPGLALHPRLVAVADVDASLATELAGRFGYGRVEEDWRRVVAADDVDLVVACLPPILNREVVLAAAAAGKHVVCEKPLADSAAVAAEMLRGLSGGGRVPWTWRGLPLDARVACHPGARSTAATSARSAACAHRSCSTTPPIPTSRSCGASGRSLAGGGIAIDTGYHLVDCARFLVGEIDRHPGPRVDVSSPSAACRAAAPSATAVRAGTVARTETMGDVDVEDAAAALVTGSRAARTAMLETSRVAIGKRVSLQVELFGSRGSADWDLERPDEFRVCLPGEAATFGYRRVLVSPAHPGAAELLIGGTDGTSIGWLGQECAMWAEFLSAIAERSSRRTRTSSTASIANAVIDALYASAASGARTAGASCRLGSAAREGFAPDRAPRSASRRGSALLEQGAHEGGRLLDALLRRHAGVFVLDRQRHRRSRPPRVRRGTPTRTPAPWTLPTVAEDPRSLGGNVERTLVEDAGERDLIGHDLRVLEVHVVDGRARGTG